MRREVTGMDARQALGARTAPKRGPPGATPARGNPWGAAHLYLKVLTSLEGAQKILSTFVFLNAFAFRDLTDHPRTVHGLMNRTSA
ncbi:hypothetical protein DZC75_07400 [Pseudomonas parafulva]|uniref:Uncharacterized protein n=1 Tax=Pseudomonas parafulva TaxID=157782 RepID=A0AAI8K7Y9_9PSED|nr:hypothetical protein DZC75_07400 [Pseudomonas parafulva]